MNVGVLFSGGKDSNYTVWYLMHQGFKISSLITVIPENQNSYMFHYPNVEWAKLQAEALSLPISFIRVKGEKNEELKSLFYQLKDLKEKLNFEGLAFGAIASEYQKTKLEFICEELKVASYAPLWMKDSKKILKEEIEAGFEIIVTACMAKGLSKEWLGKVINEENFQKLISLSEKHGFNLTFEGGEGETFVLNGPTFKKKILISESEIKWVGDSGFLIIKKANLTNKEAS
ncbi:MAG: diphthine--ammonia ligase [Candidatus Bathyarchaeia archaeon]|nr:diphthine--ammonia ligase [Candidatus Bathyarchaeota archaeon]